MSEHRNITLVRQIGDAIRSGQVSAARDAVADDVVWHYFNPRLPELAGDYHGVAGVQAFFETLARHSRGTFRMEPVSADPIGDELVVARGRVELELEGRRIETDVVVVWRVRDGRVAEVWDIPAVHAARTRPA